jgi:hypothetical protein
MEIRTVPAADIGVTSLQLHILLWQRELVRRRPR